MEVEIFFLQPCLDGGDIGETKMHGENGQPEESPGKMFVSSEKLNLITFLSLFYPSWSGFYVCPKQNVCPNFPNLLLNFGMVHSSSHISLHLFPSTSFLLPKASGGSSLHICSLQFIQFCSISCVACFYVTSIGFVLQVFTPEN